MIQLAFFTVREIGVIGDESRRLRIAMRARAFRLGNTLHAYRRLGYLVGMLLVRSLERSERILAALRCGGFQRQFHVLDDFAYGLTTVLAIGPDVLLLDEPSNGLDELTQASLVEILNALPQALLVVSHDAPLQMPDHQSRKQLHDDRIGALEAQDPTTQTSPGG